MSETKRIALIAAIVSILGLAFMLFVSCTAQAYQGHAGCPSYVPAHSTGVCAYHTGVRQASAYASTKHAVAFAGLAGSCLFGPCTAWTPWVFFGRSGRTTILNNSSSGMTVYSVMLY